MRSKYSTNDIRRQISLHFRDKLRVKCNNITPIQRMHTAVVAVLLLQRPPDRGGVDALPVPRHVIPAKAGMTHCSVDHQLNVLNRVP